jgi:hypothetical protein
MNGYSGGCLSNGDTFGVIQSVLISEVILYINCAFGTYESALIREVSIHIELYDDLIHIIKISL